MTAPALPALPQTITARGWALYRLARADRRTGRLEITDDLYDALDAGDPDTIALRYAELSRQCPWLLTGGTTR